MCDTNSKCGGGKGPGSKPSGPPANLPGWMKCPARITSQSYPAPSGVEILPISIGGRNGSKGGKSSFKCGQCGQDNQPPPKPKVSPNCPMAKPRCPGSDKKEEPSGGGIFAKISSFFGGKEESKLVEACRKLQVPDEQIRHHRDVFNTRLIVRKDGYLSPFMTKVDCKGSDDCEPEPEECTCGEEMEEEEDCEEYEEEDEEYEDEEEDDGTIEIDGCKCTCECPNEEEEECVQDAEGECIIEESAECMDPACKFFLEEPDSEAEKKKKKCLQEEFKKLGKDPEQEEKNNCKAMSNFIIRVQAPFDECTTNQTCEQILERLTKRQRHLYPEPEPKPKKEEIELVVKQISVEEPSCEPPPKPKKKCKPKVEKVDECKTEPPKAEKVNECKTEPPKIEKPDECKTVKDESCPCGNPPIPECPPIYDMTCPPPVAMPCPPAGAMPCPPPGAMPCPPPGAMPCPPPGAMPCPSPGAMPCPPPGAMPFPPPGAMPCPPPGAMPFPPPGAMPCPPPGAMPFPPPGAMPCPPLDGTVYPPPAWGMPYPQPGTMPCTPPAGICPQPEGVPCPPPNPNDCQPTTQELPKEDCEPPPPSQNDCETLTQEELLKKPFRDIKCGCPIKCPETEDLPERTISVWTPPPPPPCSACGAAVRGDTEDCFLCNITKRMRSGCPEVCENEPKPIQKIVEIVKPNPDLCTPEYLKDGSILYKGGMCMSLANQFLWHVFKRVQPGGFFDRFTGACGEEIRLMAATGTSSLEEAFAASNIERPPYHGGMSQHDCNFFLWGKIPEDTK